MPEDKIDDLVGAAYQSMVDAVNVTLIVRALRAAPRLSTPDATRLQMALFVMMFVRASLSDSSSTTDFKSIAKQRDAALACIEALCLRVERDENKIDDRVTEAEALEERRIGERERARADAAEKRAEAAEERAKKAATSPAKKPCDPECDCWSYDFH